MKYKYIFVVTYGRSGSTLPSGVLNAIPGVCVRGENANVLPLLAAAVDAATLAHGMGSQADLPDQPWYGSSRIAPVDFQRRLVAAFLEHVIRPPANAVAVGFKEIRHCVRDMPDQQYDSYIEFLLGAFDRSCIIFNVRSHEEVARSGFWRTDPFAKRHLRQCEARFRRCLARHPQTAFLVDYNRYVHDPDVLHGLFDFPGAPFDRAIVDAVLAAPWLSAFAARPRAAWGHAVCRDRIPRGADMAAQAVSWRFEREKSIDRESHANAVRRHGGRCRD